MRSIGKGALALCSALLIAGALAGSASASLTTEWENVQVSPAPVKFTGSAGGVKFKAYNGDEWECDSGTLTGEFFNSKEALVTEHYKGCGGLGFKGEFSSKLLLGRIGATNGQFTELGLRLEPAEGATLVEDFYFYAPLTNEVFGALTPYKTKSSTFTLLYEAAGEEQRPNHFFASGKPHEQLEFGGEPMTVQAKWTIAIEAGKQVTFEPTT